MESIYRRLLHEQSLIQGDHKDGKLPISMDHHTRDLATALETAKWQLEDFEREVNMLAFADKSQVKQTVIMRHLQFIRAIREHIILVEQTMSASLGNSLRNMHLNEQDRNGLAFFLSGKKPVKHIADKEHEDNGFLRRFLDPAISTSSGEDNNGEKVGETVSFVEHNLDLKENCPTNLDFRSSSSLQEANYIRYDEAVTWDLEASGPEARSYLQDNKLRDYYGRMNIFGTFGNLLTIYGKKATRSFTKRLKDGDEQRSPIYRNSQRRMQSSSWIRDLRQKSFISFRKHPLLFLLSLLLTLIVLSIWVC